MARDANGHYFNYLRGCSYTDFAQNTLEGGLKSPKALNKVVTEKREGV